MAKSITRTVLFVPRNTYSIPVDPDGAVYDSGPLFVGDLVELGISLDTFGGGANVQFFVVDANGHLFQLPGNAYTSIGIGAALASNTSGLTAVSASFGDTIQIKAYPNGVSASFGISIEGK